MKNSILILFILPILMIFGACDKSEYDTVREWSIASEMGIAQGKTHTLQPVLLVRTDNSSWRPLFEQIEGFTFEPGYEYRLRIKAEQNGSSTHYSLLETIEKIAAKSNIPESFYPEFLMEIDRQQTLYNENKLLYVRFPEAGIDEWQVWSYQIEGFEYEEQKGYLLRIGTSVVPASTGEKNSFAVQYTLQDILK